MRIFTAVLLTSLFWACAGALVAASFVAGAYQAGNVIHLTVVPNTMDVYAADERAMQAIAAQDDAIFGKGR